MAKGGKKGGRGRAASSGRSGKGDKRARVSGRGTTTAAAPDNKAPKKFGQLSRKERDMLEEYGELVPQDFQDDENDRIG
jgi:U3 small nucleolar RNA-associated protein 25